MKETSVMRSSISYQDNIAIGERIRYRNVIGIVNESLLYETLQLDVEFFLKRCFDIFLSGLGLLLSSWLGTLISIMILIEDGIPFIIKQKRVGKDGRIFNSYKFRTMRKSALNEKVNNQAVENDHRVTWFGKSLRRCALDEMPQLFNILIGEMSFVGPRPLLPYEIEVNGDFTNANVQEIPGYEKRITVRPGLTGIAQIFAPRDVVRRHKFKYDLLYIRKMNFWYDVQLIALSFIITFRGTWEKRCAKLGILNRSSR